MDNLRQKLSQLQPSGGLQGARVTLWHNCATIKKRYTSKAPQVGGGKRGKVAGFSASSRRRFLEFVNRLDSSLLQTGLFVTLTYPKEHTWDGKVAKGHLEKMLYEIKKAYDDPPLIWKLEYQRRGAAHFHLVIFKRAWIPHDWFAVTWNRIIDGGDDNVSQRAHVEGLRPGTNPLWYVAGYLGKQSTVPSKTVFPGRFWGVRARHKIEPGSFELLLTDRDANNLRRLLRQVLQVRGYAVPRAGVWYKNSFVSIDLVLKWACRCALDPVTVIEQASGEIFGCQDQRLVSVGIQGTVGVSCDINH